MNEKHLILDLLRQSRLSTSDWKQEQLNFVPLRGSWFAQSETDFDLEAEITKYFEGDKKVLLLVGDSGGGKSLYTQRLATKLWETHTESKPIPLWITLPSLKDPINHAIEETFTGYGFAAEQIEQLRKTQQFIFILDAYDEIRQLKNLYVTNRLDQWQCKIIITCRREYLYREDNYKLYFKPFQGEKPLHAAYDEIVIRSFNANQIHAYIKQYILHQNTIWNDAQKYEQTIEEIPGLRNLITTPFVLKLTMEVLPQIIESHQSTSNEKRTQITRAALYDVFIEQWFIRQEQKLKVAGQITADENIKPEFWAYAKALAKTMHEQGVTQVYYEVDDIDFYGEVTKESPWKRFFDSTDVRTKLLQTSCLVREIDQYHYAFVHASLLEYFLTRNLYENLLQQGTVSQRESEISAAIAAAANESVLQVNSSAKRFRNTSSKGQTDYFNQRLLVNEHGTLQFLVDRVEEQDDFVQSLFDRVYASRNDSEMKIAAANAITILNRAGVSFSGMDLSAIQISDADLSYALLEGTTLTNANLQNINFRQAYLSGADFSGSDMKDVDFGQLPFLEHKSNVNCISISDNGRFLAAGCGEHYLISDPAKNSHNRIVYNNNINSCIYIWELNTKAQYACLIKHMYAVDSLAFSSDSKRLRSCSLGTQFCGSLGMLSEWNIDTKKLNDVLFEGPLSDPFVFSTDGELIAIIEGTCIHLWDANSRWYVGTLEDSRVSQSLINIIISRNNEFIVSYGNRTIYFWDVKSRQLKSSITLNRDITSLAMALNGKVIAIYSYSDKKIRLLEIESRTLISRLHGGYGDPESKTCAITFSTDNVLLACADKRNVRIWNIESRRLLCVLSGHAGIVKCIKFSPDGNLIITGGADRTVRFWKGPDLTLASSDLSNQIYTSCNVAFSYSGKLFATAYESVIQLWDTDSQKPVGPILKSNGAEFSNIIFSPNDQLLVTQDRKGLIVFWDITGYKKGQCFKSKQHRLIGSYFPRENIAFTPDGKFLLNGSKEGESIQCWDIVNQQAGNLSYDHLLNDKFMFKAGKSLVFSQNYRYLLIGSGDGGRYEARIYNPENFLTLIDLHCKVTYTDMEVDYLGVTCVAFSPDAKYFSCGGYDVIVRIWDVATRTLTSLNGHTKHVNCVAFSKDNEILASGSQDNTMRLWSVADKQCVFVVNCSQPVSKICFAINNYLAIACDSGFRLWRWQYRQQKLSLNLIWYRGTLSLNAYELNIRNVINLSTLNRKLLMQMNAIGEEPAMQSHEAQDISLLSESLSCQVNIIQEPKESAQVEKTRSERGSLSEKFKRYVEKRYPKALKNEQHYLLNYIAVLKEKPYIPLQSFIKASNTDLTGFFSLKNELIVERSRRKLQNYYANFFQKERDLLLSEQKSLSVEQSESNGNSSSNAQKASPH